MPGKRTGAGLYRNMLSYLGGLVVVGNAVIIVFLMGLQFILKVASPYLGIATYLVFPLFLAVGLVFFLLGMWRESRRRRRLGTTEALPYPRVDLNEATQRRRFTYWLIGGSLLVVVLAMVSYNAFQFTESVTFCGRVCHTVMHPELLAYERSPHARVRCVDCHVGTGASWYVKSKLSGVRQVFAVLFHTYDTPIPVPIRDLRPARATCEECHWPSKFYGAQLIQNPHFRYDEKNTPDMISLLVKTGGGSAALGENAGIHWHMILERQVTFVALDPQLQQIPWVSSRDEKGNVTEYFDTTVKLPPEKLAALPRHVMDCMDCHNRPTHVFLPPDQAVDRDLAGGAIPRDLPWIKKLAVDALTADYPTRAAADRAIPMTILGYYEKHPPQLASAHQQEEKAAATVQDIYDHSVFPSMKVNWKTYASNIGHRDWPGCFRCHDGHHVSKDGKVLTRECTTCHTMPQRGPLTPLGEAVPASNQNWHPFELAGKHAEILCSRCHAAGYRPPLACAECHKLDAKAPMMENGCDSCHQVVGAVKPLNDCKTCHDTLAGLHTKGGHPDASCTDCHAPHTWVVTGRAVCLTCHDDKKAHNPDGACADCHDFKG